MDPFNLRQLGDAMASPLRSPPPANPGILIHAYFPTVARPAANLVAKLKTEDDFLECADKLEKTARKWHVGDMSKAIRNYEASLRVLEEAMKRFPTSVICKYNRAALLLHLAESHELIAYGGVPDTKCAILGDAVTILREAKDLSPDDADVRFNLGQAIVGLVDEQDALGDAQAFVVKEWLAEACVHFEHCRLLQIREFEAVANLNAGIGGSAPGPTYTDHEMSGMGESSGGGSRTAVIMETPTAENIVDTIIALCYAMNGIVTILIEHLETSHGGVWAQQYKYESLEPEIHRYLAMLDDTTPPPPPRTPFLSLTSGAMETDIMNVVSPRTYYTIEWGIVHKAFKSLIALMTWKYKMLETDAYLANLASWFDPLLALAGTSIPRHIRDAHTARAAAYLAFAAGTRRGTVPPIEPVCTPGAPRANWDYPRVKRNWQTLANRRCAALEAAHLSTSEAIGIAPGSATPEMHIQLGDVHMLLAGARALCKEDKKNESLKQEEKRYRLHHLSAARQAYLAGKVRARQTYDTLARTEAAVKENIAQHAVPEITHQAGATSPEEVLGAVVLDAETSGPYKDWEQHWARSLQTEAVSDVLKECVERRIYVGPVQVAEGSGEPMLPECRDDGQYVKYPCLCFHCSKY
ncbi:hypothetical protein EJ06DRAFT_531158 [Trichodelitschia bisporula]|uniref:TPR-like protein n=1 Tax=Trichodelitschia bisporula TaxID=703511 RepID=A0A6G1HUE2_9PEZI|nr:hypothetical protein EJ06DRAFT_531158 [Trichodelitschia bisporula]